MDPYPKFLFPAITRFKKCLTSFLSISSFKKSPKRVTGSLVSGFLDPNQVSKGPFLEIII